MIRKAVLQIAVPALLAFITWNAYLAVTHLRRVQTIAALTLESSAIQAELSGVVKDVTDMETSQRGYRQPGTPRTCSPTRTRTAGSKQILSVFAQGSRIGRSAKNYWRRSWSPWLNPSRLRWNVRSVCATGVSPSLIQAN